MYQVDPETFNKFVQDGIDKIGKEFQNKFDNVFFVVSDLPTPEQRRKINLQKGHALFGLYEGVPMSKRGSGYSGALPDQITIFKAPLEHYAKDEVHLKTIVKNTVWHEIAHYFGMNEKEVRAAEQKEGIFTSKKFVC